MELEQMRKLKLAKVRAMIAELEDRVGYNAYAAFEDLESLSIEDLEVIRKDLHETLYAPPPRRSS